MTDAPGVFSVFGEDFEESGWSAKLVTGDPKAYSGDGWYVWCTEYPEEGSEFFATEEEARKWMKENPEGEVNQDVF
jgi:hypothetical protein